jgi:hypothetical protein
MASTTVTATGSSVKSALSTKAKAIDKERELIQMIYPAKLVEYKGRPSISYKNGTPLEWLIQLSPTLEEVQLFLDNGCDLTSYSNNQESCRLLHRLIPCIMHENTP